MSDIDIGVASFALKGDTSQGVAAMKDFAKATDEATDKIKKAHGGFGEFLDKVGEGLEKFNFAVEGLKKMSEAFDKVSELAHFSAEMANLEKNIPVKTLQMMQVATEGAVDKVTLMKFAMRSLNGEMHATEDGLRVVLAAANTLSDRGFGETTAIAEKLMEVLKTGRTRELAQFNIALTETDSKQQNVNNSLLKYIELAHTEVDVNPQLKAIERLQAATKNWVSDMKAGIGDMVLTAISAVDKLTDKLAGVHGTLSHEDQAFENATRNVMERHKNADSAYSSRLRSRTRSTDKAGGMRADDDVDTDPAGSFLSTPEGYAELYAELQVQRARFARQEAMDVAARNDAHVKDIYKMTKGELFKGRPADKHKKEDWDFFGLDMAHGAIKEVEKKKENGWDFFGAESFAGANKEADKKRENGWETFGFDAGAGVKHMEDSFYRDDEKGASAWKKMGLGGDVSSDWKGKGRELDELSKKYEKLTDNKMFSAVTDALSAGVEAVISGQENVGKAIAKSLQIKLKADAMAATVDAAKYGYLAFEQLAMGNPAGAALFDQAAAGALAMAALAGVGSAAAGALAGGGGGGGGGAAAATRGPAGGGFASIGGGGSGGGGPSTIVVNVGSDFVGSPHELATAVYSKLQLGARAGYVREASGAVKFKV